MAKLTKEVAYDLPKNPDPQRRRLVQLSARASISVDVDHERIARALRLKQAGGAKGEEEVPA